MNYRQRTPTQNSSFVHGIKMKNNKLYFKGEIYNLDIFYNVQLDANRTLVSIDLLSNNVDNNITIRSSLTS